MNTYNKEFTPEVISEEMYLASKGYCSNSIGEPALHKNRGGMSDKAWTKLVDAQAEKDRIILQKREELRKEYWEKVSAGELRPPTRIENLISIANGHDDLDSVQAARRILQKQGVKWD